MISPDQQQTVLQPVNQGSKRTAPFLAPVFIVLACIVLPLALPYALTTGNESQVAGIVMGVLAVGAVIANPFWGLIIFLGLIYVRPEELIPEMAGLHLTLLISIVTLIGTVVRLAIDKEQVVRDPINFMIVGFGTMVVVCAMFGAGSNTQEAAEDIAKLVILVLLVINLARTPDKCRTLASALILFSVYLASYAVYLYFTGQALHVAEEGVDRAQATGIFGDPNDLAATLCAGLGLIIGRAYMAPKWWKLFYILLGSLLVFAIITTNSRGGLMALIAVVCGCLILFSRYKVMAIALATFVGAGMFMFAPSRMSNYDSEEESANARFMYWDNGFGMFAESPILGVGYHQFEDGNNGATAHNSFVLCFTEDGLPGYFLWMGCLYFSFKRKRIPGLAVPEEKELSVARLALAAFLVAAFWLSRTYIAILYVYIALACAFYLSYRRSQGNYNARVDSETHLGKDWLNIAFVCGLSMVFIKLMVMHYL